MRAWDLWCQGKTCLQKFRKKKKKDKPRTIPKDLLLRSTAPGDGSQRGVWSARGGLKIVAPKFPNERQRIRPQEWRRTGGTTRLGVMIWCALEKESIREIEGHVEEKKRNAREVLRRYEIGGSSQLDNWTRNTTERERDKPREGRGKYYVTMI